MNNVNKTLYIPLYGKAYVSRKGIILSDPKAEEIWEKEGFPLKGKSRSKWLAYYMGMRSAVFDRWLKEQIREDPSAAVLHLGCGMDSRCLRLKEKGKAWFDIDFPDVIEERRRYYQETEDYRMIGGDLRCDDWLRELPKGNCIAVLEGVSMYLTREELTALTARLKEKFGSVRLLMDCYTEFAAKMSKYKNPINDVGVTKVYGMDDPTVLEGFLKEHEMTPEDLIEELTGMEKRIFSHVFAGSFAGKMYRLYEYRMNEGK